MPSRKKSTTLHVVQRLNWRYIDGSFMRLPGSTRLLSHASPEEAEADRAAREKAAREQVNPFRCGGDALHYQTTLDEGRLCDWLLDADVTPPAPKGKKRNWAGWWEKAKGGLTDYQKERVWQALDRLRFFEVVERPARPVVYLVVKLWWRYNDEWFEVEEEGGTIFDTYYAYRDRKKAESHCKDNNEMARDVWSEDLEDEDEPMFEVCDRQQLQKAPFGPPPDWRRVREGLLKLADTTFWEVVEVEVDDL
jgi:hypothetical protein